jgi:pimeloyl-ACP methyl ester carboxylesterase
MQLYYQSYPEDLAQVSASSQVPIIIIPGLFGSSVNWRSFARKLSETRHVVAIDQRNHGKSPHDEAHSYADMVADLHEFCQQHNLSKVTLCGHSMGGKTAMLFALLHPELVDQLIVLDIAPVEYDHSHAPFLSKLMEVPLDTLASRKEADRALQIAIDDNATRLFLLQSLAGSPGEYHWRINLSVLNRYMSEITGFPDGYTNGEYVSELQTLFVFGELSHYVLPEHHASILKLFHNAEFVGVPEAGHWLHVEQPQLVLDAINNFVK